MAVKLKCVHHLDEREKHRPRRPEFVVSEYEGSHQNGDRGGSTLTFGVKIVHQTGPLADPRFYAFLDVQNGFDEDEMLPPIMQWWGPQDSTPSGPPFAVGSADTPDNAIDKLASNLRRVLAALEEPTGTAPPDIPGALQTQTADTE